MMKAVCGDLRPDSSASATAAFVIHRRSVLVMCVCFSCHQRVEVIVRMAAGSGVNYS